MAQFKLVPKFVPVSRRCETTKQYHTQSDWDENNQIFMVPIENKTNGH